MPLMLAGSLNQSPDINASIEDLVQSENEQEMIIDPYNQEPETEIENLRNDTECKNHLLPKRQNSLNESFQHIGSRRVLERDILDLGFQGAQCVVLSTVPHNNNIIYASGLPYRTIVELWYRGYTQQRKFSSHERVMRFLLDHLIDRKNSHPAFQSLYDKMYKEDSKHQRAIYENKLYDANRSIDNHLSTIADLRARIKSLEDRLVQNYEDCVDLSLKLRFRPEEKLRVSKRLVSYQN